jgi:hypothetical protein
MGFWSGFAIGLGIGVFLGTMGVCIYALCVTSSKDKRDGE